MSGATTGGVPVRVVSGAEGPLRGVRVEGPGGHPGDTPGRVRDGGTGFDSLGPGVTSLRLRQRDVADLVG